MTLHTQIDPRLNAILLGYISEEDGLYFNVEWPPSLPEWLDFEADNMGWDGLWQESTGDGFQSWMLSEAVTFWQCFLSRITPPQYRIVHDYWSGDDVDVTYGYPEVLWKEPTSDLQAWRRWRRYWNKYGYSMR